MNDSEMIDEMAGRIEDLEQRFTAMEGSLEQGTGELKAILHDICDRLERLEAACLPDLRQALLDAVRCLIDGRVSVAGVIPGELHGHRILGTESVQAMVEVYHRLRE